jgi:hypothetical protein
MTPKMLHIDGPWFKDAQGRTLLLRGANVGGGSKVPAHPLMPNEATLYRHHEVSFVGRPFPLDEADEHFARLKHWGLTFLRFIVTWEAVEHAGPGCYDEAYLDYLEAVVRKAGEYGIALFIDMHQDAWSRLSGGDGAPGWTFEIVGFDVTQFRATAAANIYPFDDEPFVVHWQTNYNRLAAATMFTLFFGGDSFAPRRYVGDETIQSFLQRHYLNTVKKVAERLKGMPHVVGFDTMNEPSTGFIGRQMASHNQELHLRRLGVSPTPWQAMLLGSGYPQEVDVWGLRPGGMQLVRRVGLNPHGASAWLPDHQCIWREHGVWDTDNSGQPRLLRPHHFTHISRNGSPYRVDFGRDYLRPFVKQFTQAIRQIEPAQMIFVEQVPRLEMPSWSADETHAIVNASHWYDIQTLFLRLFLPFINMNIKTGRLVFGRRRIHQLFVEQLAALKQASAERMGNAPTLIGEFGTSFNMPLKLNYALNWFGWQEEALDASFRALEANILHATIWNYTADNTNARGDGWNTEDMSIFSRDQQRGTGHLNDGGRALRAVVRPYPCRTAGTPLRLAFDMQQRRLTYVFRHDPHAQPPTVLFLPAIHYPAGYHVAVSDGTYEQVPEEQTLHYWHDTTSDIHTLEIQGRAEKTGGTG